MEEKNNAVEKIENIEQAKENKKAERERKKTQRKKIKEYKKDEREKAKLAYRREKSKMLLDRENRKQELKAERKARLDELRRQKQLAKDVRKNKRQENRQLNKKRHNGLGGWVTAVVSLGVCSLLLATALTLVFIMPSSTEKDMESLYQKSFFDTATEVDNIDANLSKAIVTSDKSALQKYLVDTAINSELCENDISQLPLEDESKFYTTKLINQIGDYSKYLNNKIIDGEDLTEKDRETLVSLYNANLTLKNSLQKMTQNMDGDYSFVDLIDAKDGDIVLDGFNELQNLSVEYPELIYDGPFSDGKDDRVIKGLNGNDVTKEDAQKVFIETFGGYGLKNIEYQGENSGNIECFNYQAEIKDDILYAQISKKGGKLLMFSYSGSCKAINIDRDMAESKAEEFLSSIGIDDMKAVWINLANNVYTINFAYNDNGVIVYSDLIKIRICAETGMVIGMEGTSYYTNHTAREIGSPTISESTAKEKVSSSIEIETSRLAIVPIGSESEKLCYEFSGRFDGTLYYVYIDAKTGRQVEMFKVIDSNEGELLI
ncbi:MAG: germination protein YpeB [Firmicutes bacterium]|nr:germination protein YpeB [Candidatus Caballimonas caccae]